MIVNGMRLLQAAPIKGMQHSKRNSGVVTYGLGEAGYDIRLKQEVIFYSSWFRRRILRSDTTDDLLHLTSSETLKGRFAIASAIEEFHMPNDLVGIVHDKSSWAREGLSVFNTVIEPGWRGFLTLELVYHGSGKLVLPAGSGIAQVVFHRTMEARPYQGRYQAQADKPVPAIKL